MQSEIRPSAGKGLGAFATKDTELTSRIPDGEPLIVICKPVYAITDFMSLSWAEKQQFLSVIFNENGSLASPYQTFMRNKFGVRNADKVVTHHPTGRACTSSVRASTIPAYPMPLM